MATYNAFSSCWGTLAQNSLCSYDLKTKVVGKDTDHGEPRLLISLNHIAFLDLDPSLMSYVLCLLSKKSAAPNGTALLSASIKSNY